MNAVYSQTIAIPGAAGGQPGVITIAAAGRFFYCSIASGPFNAQFDAQLPIAINPGMQLPGPFSRITFFNPSATPVALTFYFSDSQIESVAVTVAQLANSLASCVQAFPGQALVTVAAAGTPVPFAADAGTFARTIICIPQKTVAPVSKGGAANAGAVYVGVAGNAANKQPLPLLPGVPFEFQADTGAKLDLSSFSLDADNNGDGLVIIYW
ncbi:MAG: hypothetical protein WBN22_01070 [Verrucomicrobiia bacterium]